jgi:bifunctional non-homologous end joining protein LigD
MAKTAKFIGFIETMDCLAVPKIPEGPEWTYEIKLDGFRVEAVQQHGKVTLYSRRGNILNTKFPYIATALKELPDETILDGELVAPRCEGPFRLQSVAKFSLSRGLNPLLRLRHS